MPATLGPRTWLLSLALLATSAAQAQTKAYFDWFEYRGEDRIFEPAMTPTQYRNPVLAGFHADPSIVRVEDRYYLVNSSFTYFPGIPIFESPDLVHWKLIAHVIDRPGTLDFDGLSVSRGIFAPTIEFHDRRFYVVTTAVDSGGNFIVTATDPAGPWSDPIWLPSIGGIDPSLLFDDGRVFLINNDAPQGEPRYDGHRAIWMQELDPVRLQPIGERRVLLDGGVDPAKNPIWIEGPHVFKREGWYYLTCAEGGTGPQHSQVVLRSRDRWGPYQPYANNPILTQRDLPEDRADPITNAGHADLVEATDGSWWAVFLASRNYDRVHYNTGRETFLLPVQWRDGWPMILEADKTIPTLAEGPGFMQRGVGQAPFSGNFVWRDEFDKSALDTAWRYVRVPKPAWADLTARAGWLSVPARGEDLDTLRNPAFLARRQQHTHFDASTAMAWPEPGVEAGLAAFQNERYWFFLGVRADAEGGVVFLQRNRAGVKHIVAEQRVGKSATVQLKISGDGGRYDFAYDDGNGWRVLRQGEDGSVLSTDVAGGFVGASIGPFARTRAGASESRP